MLLEMGLSTEEKVFTVEYYFHSYGSGCEGGPSLKKVTEQFQERFNKTAPSNTVMLSVIMKFRCSGSVLCQQKGKSGQPVTLSTKKKSCMCSLAGAALALTKSTMNGLENERQQYIRSQIV
ncbi:hypothetical protein B7P43_G10674 [Cryptotermes secundus]|uniref:DUF4817 domain-containing protein n=1 Tax=Cryptotermes secundus TaxID=105785 RepID=A0A2J7R5U2_9NEOP|nr:hypothetical protein B7P43_G10674 [Cryptotermes secundus]